MNKYIVLSALTLVFSLTLGCQNCGYKTAHSSRYETLVGTTRLASPQTNCRYNTCSVSNACNPCNPCNTCNTQLLANNGQIPSAAYAQGGYQNGWYQSYAGENAPENASLLDGTQQQTAQGEVPLRWRRVTDEEQQYANSAVNPVSAGVASALSAPAFGSPAPAPNIAPPHPNSSRRAARGVASALETPEYPAPGAGSQYPGRYPGQYSGQYPSQYSGQYPVQYPNQYPGQYPNSSPRASMGVASALTPGRPSQGSASEYSGQYPGQYPANTSRRTTAGVDSALSVPDHPLPPRYSNSAPRAAMGIGSAPVYGSPTPASDSDSIRWRRVTEEEQQYYSSPGRTMQDNAGYSNEQPLTVPVYQGNNDAMQMPESPSAPEIDPNALPMPESPTGTF